MFTFVWLYLRQILDQVCRDIGIGDRMDKALIDTRDLWDQLWMMRLL